jgi:hypothetical protein
MNNRTKHKCIIDMSREGRKRKMDADSGGVNRTLSQRNGGVNSSWAK